MDAGEIQSFLKYSANEKRIIEKFDIPSDLFLPLLLSLKAGGSWSYSTEELTTVSVKNVITYYDEKKMIGHTLEEIYLFLEPRIVEQKGTVYRLEKCSRKGERVLVTRPYAVTMEADRIILVTINPQLKKIEVKELEEKRIELTGSPAYSAAHEMEHVADGDIEGTPLWEFEFKD